MSSPHGVVYLLILRSYSPKGVYLKKEIMGLWLVDLRID